MKRIPPRPQSSRDYSKGHSKLSSTRSFYNPADRPDLKAIINFMHRDNPFLIAAEIGNEKAIQAVLKGPKVNLQQKDHLGRNALHLAVCSDNERIVELLLASGIEPNVKDNLGMTPLSLCLMRSPSLKLTKLLFKYGARLLPRTSPTDNGIFLQFIMFCVPTEEQKRILKLLISKGALINDPDAPGGRQALHFAAMSNNCELITTLVDLGADINWTNHRNETPKDVAIIFKCRDAQFCLEDIEISNLIDGGVSSRSRSKALLEEEEESE